MILQSRMTHRATLALAAVLVIAGCSALPTAPQPEGASPAAPTQREAAGPAASTPASARSATTTKQINGLIGGTVTAGSFTVVIPPSAISGSASVTVTQADVTRPFVDLSISPSSANKFNIPVTLIADASPMDPTALPQAYISWLDPVKHAWVQVPSSSVDLQARTVSAPLWHFSQYSVEKGGKAGW